MNLEESIKLVVEGCGVQLYDTIVLRENKNNIFRIYITSPNGISLDKCSEISRMISPLLDINEPMHDKYSLEVSSPGIERKLKTLNHFICSVGDNVKIKEHSTQIIQGKLIKVNDDETMNIQDENGNIQMVKFGDILSASTYYEWKK